MTTEEARSWATNRLRDATAKADYWDMRRVNRFGFSDEEILAVARALVSGEGGPILWDQPACSELATQTKPIADWHVKRYDEAVAEGDDLDTYSLLGTVGFQYGTLAVMGCLDGREGKIADVYEAFAYVTTAPQRVREDRAEEPKCLEAFARIDGIADVSRLENMGDNEAYTAQQIKYVLDWYFGALVSNRCVDEL